LLVLAAGREHQEKTADDGGCGARAGSPRRHRRPPCQAHVSPWESNHTIRITGSGEVPLKESGEPRHARPAAWNRDSAYPRLSTNDVTVLSFPPMLMTSP
jgi:hypothetical protein